MATNQNDTNSVQTAADILAMPADAAPSMPAVVDQAPANTPADAPVTELAVPVVEQAPMANTDQPMPVQAEALPADAPVQDAATAAVDNPEDTESASMGLFGGILGGGFAGLTPATAAAGALGVAFVANNNSSDDSAAAPASSSGGALGGVTSQLPAEVTGPIADSPLGDPLNMVVSGVDNGSSALPISSLPTDALPTSSLPLPV
ncbi:MAG TPA: hypothetical protein VGE55_07370 [Limnobacter sp.]|uniref:hypothetical protein n=1 Tax=Limnobacter sp. TaxID=2003368 RepID=UPI002ED84009